ncbi:MAG: Fur family transcriptional regulator [Polyangiales bacterium]
MSADRERSRALLDRERWRALLRGAGLRVTAPRLAVLDHLSRARTPVSHPELTDALAALGCDRATIYRNLTDLTDAGIIRRADLGDHVWRFEIANGDHGSDRHPHFVCDACGDVMCLPASVVRLAVADDIPRSVHARAVEIQVRGRCDRCA